MKTQQDERIGRLFVEQTSYHDFARTDRRQGKPQPPIYWERDAKAPCIALPPLDEQALPDKALWSAMAQRRSRRAYSKAPLTLLQLSALCWMTQGVQEEIEFNGRATRRLVPSAGAKHAVETLILVRRAEGLTPGLYRYLPQKHALALYKETDQTWERALDEAFTSNRFQKQAAATFFWAAVPARMVWHHGQRGYRNLYLDAGHIGQNLYLAAEGLGLSACTMCVFDDERMHALLGLEESMFLLYTAAVGGRAQDKTERI